jgi:uncharacterized protein (TIGR03067 family)
MRRIATGVILLALAGLAGAADDPKAAAAKLEGTYEVVEIRIGGKPDPKKDAVKAVVVKDGTLTMKGPKDDPAKFVLNPAKSPAHIDITADGDLKILGVYEAKETTSGLELTIAMRLGPKAERPTDLKGEGKDEVLLKLLRKPAK